MTKSKIVVALEAKVVALEAQLALGRTLYQALRDSHPATIAKRATPNTSYWRNSAGALWAKTRQSGSNVSSSRRVPEDAQGNVVVPGLGAIKVVPINVTAASAAFGAST